MGTNGKRVEMYCEWKFEARDFEIIYSFHSDYCWCTDDLLWMFRDLLSLDIYTKLDTNDSIWMIYFAINEVCFDNIYLNVIWIYGDFDISTFRKP